MMRALIRATVWGAGCVGVGIALGSAFPLAQVVAVPESHRFAVVSQQILDSGAKLVIIRDTKGGFMGAQKCYAIYEAGVGAVLGDVPCD